MAYSTMQNAVPSLIAAGPWHAAEFSAVRGAVEGDGRWTIAESLDDVIASIGQDRVPPEIVLLAQPRPGCHEQDAVERLRMRAPLMRVVVVAGAWCEGELRTGRPLSGVLRVYWHQFPAWWRAAMCQRERGERPPWAEPLTDPRTATLATSSAAGAAPSVAPGMTIAVNSADYSVYETLRAGLLPLGWNCQWKPRHVSPNRREAIPHAAPAAAIWDGGQLDADEQQAVQEFSRQVAATRTPVVTLLDFPRPEHFDVARSAGAACVIAKPYRLDLLHDELLRLTSERW